MIAEAGETDGDHDADTLIVDDGARNTAVRPNNRPRAATGMDEGAMLQDRTQALRSLSNSMANIASRGQEQEANVRQPKSRHQIWAELVGLKVEDLDVDDNDMLTSLSLTSKRAHGSPRYKRWT